MPPTSQPPTPKPQNPPHYLGGGFGQPRQRDRARRYRRYPAVSSPSRRLRERYFSPPIMPNGATNRNRLIAAAPMGAGPAGKPQAPPDSAARGGSGVAVAVAGLAGSVGVGVFVGGAAACVGAGVRVGVGVSVRAAVGVDIGAGIGVGSGVGVGVGVGVGSGVGVGVGVGVGSGVGVGVGVGSGVGVGVGVGVGSGVGVGRLPICLPNSHQVFSPSPSKSTFSVGYCPELPKSQKSSPPVAGSKSWSALSKSMFQPLYIPV